MMLKQYYLHLAIDERPANARCHRVVLIFDHLVVLVTAIYLVQRVLFLPILVTCQILVFGFTTNPHEWVVLFPHHMGIILEVIMIFPLLRDGRGPRGKPVESCTLLGR